MSLILSGTDGLSDVDGTAATPAIRGTDANTGIFFGTDIIGFSEGGVEAMRINSSGYVGIGTSSPSSLLHLRGDGNAVQQLRIANSQTSYNTDLALFTHASGDFSIGLTNSAVPLTNQTMTFLVNNSSSGQITAMKLDSSGNLGLGVTPSAWASNPKAMQIGTGGAIAGWTGAIPELDVSCNIYYGSSNYRYITTGKATLHVQYDGAYTWYNAPSGTAGNAISLTQAMTLTAAGDLLINKTTASATVGTGQWFVADGRTYATVASSTAAVACWHLYSTNAAAYRFYVTADGVINATNTSIAAISDQRLKENVRDLNVGLAEILALKPRVFDWKEGKGKDTKNDRGFIAQEFEQVFPDLIGEWIDPSPEGEAPYKSLRQDLIPMLVKAIQEQQALITQLTARITALESA